MPSLSSSTVGPTPKECKGHRPDLQQENEQGSAFHGRSLFVLFYWFLLDFLRIPDVLRIPWIYTGILQGEIRMVVYRV